MEEMVMENFLMNLLGISAIVGMLYGMLVMWRNIDKELAKMDATRKKSGPVQDRSLYTHTIAVMCKPTTVISH
jgi:hypothetical protein